MRCSTTLTWGVWGAFTGVPSEHGFPDTLTYVVWALTMIAPAAWALRRLGCARCSATGARSRWGLPSGCSARAARCCCSAR